MEKFAAIRTFIERELGIKMPVSKVPMLESRLVGRMRVLGLTTYEQYEQYLFHDPKAREEVVCFIDAVTTNKTDFYREYPHFEYLSSRAMPTLAPQHGAAKWKAWCAGCSTGEEPYTLAMVMDDYLRQTNNPDFAILATDISTRVLEQARGGIYQADRVTPLPDQLRKRYVLKSRDPHRHDVRIAPELRRRISFHRLNFMDPDYGVKDMFDVIFFRNVAIYFDAPTQERVVGKLCAQLRPGGYFFIGHSESLPGRGHNLEHVGPAIYRKGSGT